MEKLTLLAIILLVIFIALCCGYLARTIETIILLVKMRIPERKWSIQYTNFVKLEGLGQIIKAQNIAKNYKLVIEITRTSEENYQLGIRKNHLPASIAAAREYFSKNYANRQKKTQ